MQTDIGKNWKYVEGCEDVASVPAGAEEVDFPIDLLRRKNRNYKAALGRSGSYYDPIAATFYKVLPRLNKTEWIVLVFDGVCGQADVCLNGIPVAHISGDGKHCVDISQAYVFGANNVCAVKLWAPQMAGKYTGAGIAGGVWLTTHDRSVAIKEDGIFASTQIENGKARVSVGVELYDKTGEASARRQTYTVEAVLYNARGKKAARKIKKCKLKNVYVNTCTLCFKLSRYYMWSAEDPYMYSVHICVRDENGAVADESDAPVGIVSRGLSPKRGLVLNGRSRKLKGAAVQPDNGILGRESTPSVEEYKLSRIKDIGYNAVRFTGCPTEAALGVLDRIGLMAMVDLFPVWSMGKYPYDGHVDFAERAVYDCERMICSLRKHPSVVLYGICDDAPETYGRGEGEKTAQLLCETVRGLDDTRPIVVNAYERVPLKAELDKAGIKGRPEDATAAIGMAREKDLFGKLTEASFACGDIAGYAYLYPRYADDRTAYPDRLIVGTASHPSRSFEAMEECEKNANVVGEFVYCAADYLGSTDNAAAEDAAKLLPPHVAQCGDLDLIYNRKPSAYYRSIVLGDRTQSCITVRDPESSEDKEGHTLWNWPHSLGNTLDIEVYSRGEVVALYRDGKSVGRKLGGKSNRYITKFKTTYCPGTLEAVGYHKGRECSRVQLSSAGSPRGIKLTCDKKSRAADECFLVQISVVDRDGREVPFAAREVELQVTGSGVLYALGSADPAAQHPTAGITSCPVFEGKALAVVKPTADGDGKIFVKATGDGLLSGKVTLKVK